ncbi:LPXTG-motif cell wall anchor domain-containing protein [Streptomyces sp. 2231.1]|nr:LPXTG-motif cell wall anchor domain-containing protein [Streptomyces sp. 2231.1]
MRRATRNSVIAVAAASGAMALVGSAHADSAADGAAVGSPGLISGNSIQLPVHIPVNACGNTVNVVGLLNPAMGNRCANEGGGAAGTGASSTSSSRAAEAASVTRDSPGVVSGNGIQLPVDLPVNVTGNSIDVVGIANPVFGNQSTNTSHHPETETPAEPPTRVTPPVHSEPPTAPRPHVPPKPAPVPVPDKAVPVLPHTGTDGMLAAAGVSAASLLGGTLLYRRFRTPAAQLKG